MYRLRLVAAVTRGQRLVAAVTRGQRHRGTARRRRQLRVELQWTRTTELGIFCHFPLQRCNPTPPVPPSSPRRVPPTPNTTSAAAARPPGCASPSPNSRPCTAAALHGTVNLATTLCEDDSWPDFWSTTLHRSLHRMPSPAVSAPPPRRPTAACLRSLATPSLTAGQWGKKAPSTYGNHKTSTSASRGTPWCVVRGAWCVVCVVRVVVRGVWCVHPLPMATTRLQPLQADEHSANTLVLVERRIWPARPNEKEPCPGKESGKKVLYQNRPSGRYSSRAVVRGDELIVAGGPSMSTVSTVGGPSMSTVSIHVHRVNRMSAVCPRRSSCAGQRVVMQTYRLACARQWHLAGK